MKLYKDGITCEIADTDIITIERLKAAGYIVKNESNVTADKTTKKDK